MLGRRELVKGVAGMFGLGRPMPSRFPLTTPQAAGVAPGSGNRFRVLIVSGPSGAIVGVFVYAPGATPGPGTPPQVAITGSSADPFGNSVRPGDAPTGGTVIALGTAPAGGTQSYVELAPGNPALLALGTGDAGEISPGEVISAILGSGTTRTLAAQLVAPRGTLDASTLHSAQVQARSAAIDQSTPATVVLQAITDVINTGQLTVTPSGVTVTRGTFTADNASAHVGVADFQAGTKNSVGTSIAFTDSTGMSGEFPAVQTDFSIITVTAASATAITKQYTIPANNAQAATIYRLTCGGFGTQGSTAQNLGMDSPAFGVSFNVDTAAAAQMPINALFHWEAEDKIIVTSAPSATATARGTGKFGWSQATTGGVNNTLEHGQTTSTDSVVATNGSHTIFKRFNWGSTTGAPTITCLWSMLERLGP